VLCITFIEHPAIEKEYSNSFIPVFAFCVLIVPLFDTLRVFTIRILNKKSPFKGDRKHLHHILVDGGLAHWQASAIMYLANISIILLAYSLKHISALLLLGSVLALCLLLSLVLVAIHKPKTKLNNTQAVKH
jgi:hypothetical protein